MSPKFCHETLFQQTERLEEELHAVRMRHAMQMANARLYYLNTRRMLGTEFTILDVTVSLSDQFRMEGVQPDLIPALVSLVVDRYHPVS